MNEYFQISKLENTFHIIFIKLKNNMKSIKNYLIEFLNSIKYIELRNHKIKIDEYLSILSDNSLSTLLDSLDNESFDDDLSDNKLSTKINIYDEIESYIYLLNEIVNYILDFSFWIIIIQDKSKTFIDNLNIVKKTLINLSNETKIIFNDLISSIRFLDLKNEDISNIYNLSKNRGEISTEIYLIFLRKSNKDIELKNIKKKIFNVLKEYDIFDKIKHYNKIQLLTYFKTSLDKKEDNKDYIDIAFPQCNYYVKYDKENLVNKNHIIKNEILGSITSGLNFKLVKRLKTIQSIPFIRKKINNELLPFYNGNIRVSKNGGLSVENISSFNQKKWTPFGFSSLQTEYILLTNKIIQEKIKKDKRIDIYKKFNEESLSNKINKYEISKENIVEILLENIYNEELPDNSDDFYELIVPKIFTFDNYITKALSTISFNFLSNYLLDMQIKKSNIQISEISRELKSSLMIHIIDVSKGIWKSLKSKYRFNNDIFKINNEKRKVNIMNELRRLYKNILTDEEIPAINIDLKFYCSVYTN